MAPDEDDRSPALAEDFIDLVGRVRLSAPVATIQRPRAPRGGSVLRKLEALGVEAVSLLAGDRLEQGLLLLHAARRLQLIHGGQVEEHALVQGVLGVLLDHGLQLPEGVLELAQVEQTHSGVVVGHGICWVDPEDFCEESVGFCKVILTEVKERSVH